VVGRDAQSALLVSFGEVREGPPEAVPEDRWRALIAAAPDLAQRQPQELVGLLIVALGHPARRIALPAAYLLRHLTGLDHGYRPFGSVEARHEAHAA